MNNPPMTVREYLSQAHHIDLNINDMLEQVRHLMEQATKVTTVLSDMPRSSSPELQPVENIVVRYVDLQREINAKIDSLVDLRNEITAAIECIPSSEHQCLLRQRYLCFKPWTQVAELMGFDLRHIYRMHHKALAEMEKILARRCS